MTKIIQLCDKLCRSNKLCTLGILYDLLRLDMQCVCTECIVKAKCLDPCEEYTDQLKQLITVASEVDPTLLDTFIERRKDYLREVLKESKNVSEKSRRENRIVIEERIRINRLYLNIGYHNILSNEFPLKPPKPIVISVQGEE